MRPSLLLPPVFRIIGAILIVPGVAFAIIFLNRNQHYEFWGEYGMKSFIDEIAVTLLVTGLIFIGFARFNNETEQITETRLNALYWSVLVDCLFFTGNLVFSIFHIDRKVSILFFDFFDFISNYNLFLLLLVFIIRFHVLFYYLKREKKVRKLYFLPYNRYTVIAKIICLLLIVRSILSVESQTIDDLLNFLPKVLWVLLPISFFIWLWSKEKDEIAPIKNIRLKAMQIASYIFYSLFLILTWLVYGLGYGFILNFGLAGLIVIFFIVFYLRLYIALKTVPRSL